MAIVIPPRLPEWRRNLSTYMAGVDRTAFKAGKFDCALFCAGAVQAMTGFDAARGWRGYRTLREGRNQLERKGFSDWWDMISDRELQDVSGLRVGDVALVQGDGELAGGICLGSHIKVVSVQGTALVRRGHAVRGFRI